MWKLLRLLLFGHEHAWKILREARLSNECGSAGTRYYLQCTQCGTVKKKDCI